jgi:hypothetical protein
MTGHNVIGQLLARGVRRRKVPLHKFMLYFWLFVLDSV